MTPEQREAYIKQVKRNFDNYHSGTNRKMDTNDSDFEQLAGYWKYRFVIALLIFVVIFSLHITKTQTFEQTYKKIASAIEKDFSTESISAWIEQESYQVH